MRKRDWLMNDKQRKIFENLWRQTERIFDWRTHHQGKRGTERYREGVKAFCKHLAIHYRSKNFKNIRDQHLDSFIKESQKCGVGAATIKTDLSAIRKLHSLLPEKRYELESLNGVLGAEIRKITGVDRAWENEEAQKASHLARSMGRFDVDWAIRCARTLGLRLEEVTALNRSQIRKSIKDGFLGLKNTKGGIPRDVPLNAGAVRVLKEMEKGTLQGDFSERIFVSHGRTHSQAMKSIQNWIHNHRSLFTSTYTGSEDDIYTKNLGIDEQRPNLTFHGLRHAYARQQYELRVKNGMKEQEARKEVAVLLGHGRDDVTRIYLGSMKEKDVVEKGVD